MFLVSNVQLQGLCSRCQMICLDQKTGQRSAEPLKTLGLVRGTKVCHNNNFVLKDGHLKQAAKKFQKHQLFIDKHKIIHPFQNICCV